MLKASVGMLRQVSERNHWQVVEELRDQTAQVRQQYEVLGARAGELEQRNLALERSSAAATASAQAQ